MAQICSLVVSVYQLNKGEWFMHHNRKLLCFLIALFCCQIALGAVPEICNKYENKNPCSFPGETYHGICTAPDVCINAYHQAQKKFDLQTSTNWSFQMTFENNTYLPVTVSINENTCMKAKFHSKKQKALIIYPEEKQTFTVVSNFDDVNCSGLSYAYADISVISNTQELPSDENYSATLINRYAIGEDYRVLMQSKKDTFSGKQLWDLREIIKYDENGNGEVIQSCSKGDTTSCKTFISLDYDWRDDL
jgi:hypothetical protein